MCRVRFFAGFPRCGLFDDCSASALRRAYLESHPHSDRLGRPDRLRQRHDLRRNVRPRRNLGDQPVEVALAPVPRPRKQLAVILLREMGGQHVDRRQVDLPAGEHLEHPRKPPSRPRRGDPLASRRLGHPQPLDTEREQGRARLPKVEPALVDLDQIRQQLGRDLVGPPRQHLHALEHPVIGHVFKTSHRHALHIPRTQDTPARALSAPLSSVITPSARIFAAHLAETDHARAPRS
jgi:hypothetical protein